MVNILNDNLTQQLLAVGFPEPQSIQSAKMDHRSILSVEFGYSLGELWQWLPVAIRNAANDNIYHYRLTYSIFTGWTMQYALYDDGHNDMYDPIITVADSNIVTTVALTLLECARLTNCHAIYDFGRGGRPYESFCRAD